MWTTRVVTAAFAQAFNGEQQKRREQKVIRLIQEQAEIVMNDLEQKIQEAYQNDDFELRKELHDNSLLNDRHGFNLRPN